MRPDPFDDLIFLLLVLVVMVASGVGAYFYGRWCM
jgi:hypothetical protein